MVLREALRQGRSGVVEAGVKDVQHHLEHEGRKHLTRDGEWRSQERVKNACQGKVVGAAMHAGTAGLALRAADHFTPSCTECVLYQICQHALRQA